MASRMTVAKPAAALSREAAAQKFADFRDREAIKTQPRPWQGGGGVALVPSLLSINAVGVPHLGPYASSSRKGSSK